MKGLQTNELGEKPKLDDHPGLDNDEAPDAGKMMTASGSTALHGTDTDDGGGGRPTLDDHPGPRQRRSPRRGKDDDHVWQYRSPGHGGRRAVKPAIETSS